MVFVSGLIRVLSFAAPLAGGSGGGRIGGGAPRCAAPFSEPFVLNAVSFLKFLRQIQGSPRPDDSRKYVFDFIRKEIALSESIIGREDDVRHINIARAVWPERFHLDRIEHHDPFLTGGIIDISAEGGKFCLTISAKSGEFDDRLKRSEPEIEQKRVEAAVVLQELLHCSGLEISEIVNDHGIISFEAIFS